MAAADTKVGLPPTLDSKSAQPPFLDGTTRLYTAYTCPYAQRVWIALNYKGLQDKIQLVPINLGDKPAWYKDVYPPSKVPALEHNNEVKGESLDLLKYLDSHFEGPKLFPDDPAKKEFAEEMLAYAGTFGGAVLSHLKGGPESETIAGFDKLEVALSKFDDGPFFLGQFSAVDIAFAPFVERYQPLLLELKNYDITSGRPKLGTWIEELNKLDAYKQSKWDINELTSAFKKRVLGL
ncbi:protein IN2-1 homolog B [Spinacia oleracea]|uniref:Protein IN2-1 homolog B n=1 Tax=Spinacia oleracea TaxID=3562 RepID=A0A9R0JLI6_SPIOL|nr:protein IN2-1 homolog B-like [Spinacia oleracea]